MSYITTLFKQFRLVCCHTDKITYYTIQRDPFLPPPSLNAIWDNSDEHFARSGVSISHIMAQILVYILCFAYLFFNVSPLSGEAKIERTETRSKIRNVYYFSR